MIYLLPIALLAFMHVHNELRIYRRGGDVFNWTVRLDKLLRRMK